MTVVKTLLARPSILAGSVGVAFFLVVTVLGPSLAPYPFDRVIRGTDIGLESRRALVSQAPSQTFRLGTDQRGRDVLSRLLWGGRETIGLPLVATALSVVLGAPLGLLLGYVGGVVDDIASRVLDGLVSIPTMVLALVAISTIVPVLSARETGIVPLLGAQNISLTAVIVIVYVPIIARVTRSATFSIRDRGYIEEARLRGERIGHIVLRQILPGVWPVVIVEAALRFSYAIILVTSLGFLGLGVQPPSPEWGRMVLDARTQFADAPWELWYPVAAIALLIISVNLMSDGLRRVLRNED